MYNLGNFYHQELKFIVFNGLEILKFYKLYLIINKHFKTILSISIIMTNKMIDGYTVDIYRKEQKYR